MDYPLDAQITLLGELKKAYGAEYDRLPRTAAGAAARSFYLQNGMFESVDAELMWGMIRRVKPKHILEIGAGWTTALASQALGRNADEGVEGELVTVDPNPAGPAYDRPRVTIHARHLQEVGDLFSLLGPGDMILVDSSHIFVTDGEIDLVLRALTGLKGVYAQFHDIFLPQGYPEQWADRGYNEQAELERWLGENDHQLLIAANYLYSEHPDVLAGAIGSYDPERPIGPGAFWFKTPGGDEKTITADALIEDGTEAHAFVSDRNGKACLVPGCGKGPRAAVHTR